MAAPAESSFAAPRPQLPERTRIARAWALNLLVGILALGTFALGATHHAPLTDLRIDWWWIAIAIAVCERWPVRLELRRASHAFSLTDIPLTLAIVFASGPAAVAGVAVGTAATMAMERLPPVKAVFNVVQFVFATCLGLTVFHLAAGMEPSFGPLAWLGAFAATQIGGLVTITLIASVIRLTEGELTRAELREMYAMDAVVTCTNTSLALLAALVIIANPAAIPIMLIPVIFAFLGYRAYIRARERGEKLELLYETNRTIASSAEVASALEGLLEHARDAFRVERAEAVLLAEDGGAFRTRIGPADEREIGEPVDPRAARALTDLVAGAPVALTSPIPFALEPLLESGGTRNAMAARLVGSEGVVGAVVLTNRASVGRGFGHADLALFDALAASASAALQYEAPEGAAAQLRDLQHQLRHQTNHDALTGLANRTLFTKEVAAAAAGGEVAVLFADLDDFKTVNDTMGHEAGDQLLCAAATRITRAVRAGDTVARLGGDEFAVLLGSGGGDVGGAATEIAQRILNAFDLPVALGERLLSVGLSVGIATADAGSDPRAILRDADVAMYAAKAGGKDRYMIFTPGMRDAVLERHELREALKLAIARRELDVQYQPIVDIETSEMVAAEALVRWNHPTRGRMSPAQFIPLAEETGLIADLGRVVLHKACHQAAAWVRAGNPPINMQVNLSGGDLDDPELVSEVRRALRESGLPPERLVLELTETVLVGDAAHGGEMLERLRALGVKIALDDFGTGYSSLSYLRSLPLDVIKIAKEFVDNIAVDSEDATVVRLVVEFAAHRDLRVIAEGIETDTQHEALRALGCDLGQGYLFSRPVDGDDPRLSARPATPLSNPR